jgi:enoyl-CoA hydratase
VARRLVDQPVSYDRRGSAAVVTIRRPERRNAIDGTTADALEFAYERWIADPEAKVMVLTGEGPDAFCAGADLKAIATLQHRVGSEGGPEGFTRRIAPKPTIAAIEGWAVAGGLELAAWCDIRIASETAKLGCTERRFGVPLIDGGTQRLPRIIGHGRALDLILSGRIVDATEALAIGLVSRVVPAGTSLEAALALAEELAGFPPEALAADRTSALEAFDRPLPEGLAVEAERGAAAVAEGSLGAERFISGEGRGGGSIPAQPN